MCHEFFKKSLLVKSEDCTPLSYIHLGLLRHYVFQSFFLRYVTLMSLNVMEGQIFFFPLRFYWNTYKNDMKLSDQCQCHISRLFTKCLSTKFIIHNYSRVRFASQSSADVTVTALTLRLYNLSQSGVNYASDFRHTRGDSEELCNDF